MFPAPPDERTVRTIYGMVLMSELVAFTGLAGSGKSEATRVLLDEGWHLVKFAGPLKAMFKALIREADLPDTPRAYIEGRLKEEPIEAFADCTPRYIMQTLGTEWGRSFISETLWLDIAERKITSLRASGANVVVDDCRFENEAQLIGRLGGNVCQIDGRVEKSAAMSHASENLPHPHCVIYNTGSLNELRKHVRKIFVEID